MDTETIQTKTVTRNLETKPLCEQKCWRISCSARDIWWQVDEPEKLLNGEESPSVPLPPILLLFSFFLLFFVFPVLFHLVFLLPDLIACSLNSIIWNLDQYVLAYCRIFLTKKYFKPAYRWRTDAVTGCRHLHVEAHQSAGGRRCRSCQLLLLM